MISHVACSSRVSVASLKDHVTLALIYMTATPTKQRFLSVVWKVVRPSLIGGTCSRMLLPLNLGLELF